MRKVKAICIYHSLINQIDTFHVMGKSGHFDLVWHDEPAKYKYYSFSDLYRDCLLLLKSNNAYVESHEEFGVTWYDIGFIDLDYYNGVQYYGYRREDK